jgi:isopenicillin-N epimerase
LWATSEKQSMLHFPVVSWGRNKGFREEFEHTATADPTSYLAAPEGIGLLREWEFEACVAYMHGLAWEAAGMLTERWRTSFEIPRAMVGTMVTVPLPREAGTTDEEAARLRLALLVEDRIEVQLHAWRGRLWTRVSAQIYNDRSDIAKLADAVARRTARPATVSG